MLRFSSIGLVIGLLLGLFTASSSHAQTLDDVLRYSERSPATGAHDLGWMSANTTAGSGTYTALFGNPAGLGWASSSVVAGSLIGDFTTNETRFQAPGEELSAPFGRTQTEYRIGNAAFTYRVPTAQGALVFGGAINRVRSFDRTLVSSGINAQSSITDTFLPDPSGFQVASNGDLTFDRDISRLAFLAGAIEFFDTDFQDGLYPFDQAVAPGPIFGTNVEQYEDLVETGGLYEASFGGSVEVAPNVMLGGSFLVAFGSYSFDRIYEEIDVNNTHTNDLYDVLLDDGTLLRGFNSLTFEQGIEADLTGVGARFGASAAPVDNVRLGVSFAMPTYYTITETFGTRIETFFNEGGSLSAGRLDDNEFEYEVHTPWRVSLGGEFSTGPLTLAGDVEVVDWSTLEIRSDGVRFTTINRQIRDLDVTVSPRLGAAFAIDDLTLRSGFAFQPNPEPNSMQGDRTFFSGGLSYQFGPQLAVDFSWMQERFKDEFVSYSNISDWNLDPNLGGARSEIVAPRINEDIARNSFKLGIRYQF